MTHRPHRTHMEVMAAQLALAGRAVVDVGCGDGALVRALTRRGGEVIGLDCGLDVLAKAAGHERAGDEHYLAARGEALPLAEGCVDLVIFFNSLHHVPVEAQAAALVEAARIVRPSGHVYVMEPLAEGAYFALTRQIEDETVVRAAAYRCIRQAVAEGLYTEEVELEYDAPVKLANYEAFRQRVVDVAPDRRDAAEALDAELRARFAASAEPVADGFLFRQPSRVNLLRRPAD